MQERHKDERLYFNETVETATKYYTEYVESYKEIKEGFKVLEIGCGYGGNLLPFLKKGCSVMGMDLSSDKIKHAKIFFSEHEGDSQFFDGDFLEFPTSDDRKFDIIMVHDVIEHIEAERKANFILKINEFIKDDGVVFWAFPAWQMPFGGHQQICSSKFCSKAPFIHLLPNFAYRKLLTSCGVTEKAADELLEIKSCKVPMELFEKLAASTNHQIVNRKLWFINPHYEKKFNLKPRKLCGLISQIPYIRNFFSTSCFYITKLNR